MSNGITSTATLTCYADTDFNGPSGIDATETRSVEVIAYKHDWYGIAAVRLRDRSGRTWWTTSDELDDIEVQAVPA